jgi:hypothetical protein
MIPIWKCDYCGNPACIMLRVDSDSPDICPWSGSLSVFVPEEITEEELKEYIKEYSRV